MVRSGLVIAWRFATSPTSTSPDLANRPPTGRATALGIGDDDRLPPPERRPPSWSSEIDSYGLAISAASYSLPLGTVFHSALLDSSDTSPGASVPRTDRFGPITHVHTEPVPYRCNYTKLECHTHKFL